MKGDVFYEYVANGLNKWIIDNKVEKPIIFFVDGHKSHLTLELSEYCSNNGIILYAFPPNTTHMMQPADVSVFKPLKREWKRIVASWQRSCGNIENVTTLTFCPLLESTILQMKSLPHTIRNGFRKCGLYPFDPNAVDYTKCVRDVLEKQHQTMEKHQEPQVDSTANRFDIACSVIESIKINLEEKSLSTNTILQEILKEKQKALGVMDEDSVLHPTVMDALNALEPGTYDFEFDNVFAEGSVLSDVTSTERVMLMPNLTTTPSLDLNVSLLQSEFTSPKPSTSGLKIGSLPDHILVPTTDLTSPQNIATTPIASTSKCYVGIYPATHATNEAPSSTEARINASRLTSTECSPFVEKHLITPTCSHIFSQQRLKKTIQTPSAISSLEWRKIIMKKENEKKEKAEAVKKRKDDRLKNKEQQNFKRKKPKVYQVSKSGKCEEDLVSDLENDDLKNVGCDNCAKCMEPMKCTDFSTYEQAAESPFYCDF